MPIRRFKRFGRNAQSESLELPLSTQRPKKKKGGPLQDLATSILPLPSLSEPRHDFPATFDYLALALPRQELAQGPVVFVSGNRDEVVDVWLALKQDNHKEGSVLDNPAPQFHHRMSTEQFWGFPAPIPQENDNPIAIQPNVLRSFQEQLQVTLFYHLLEYRKKNYRSGDYELLLKNEGFESTASSLAKLLKAIDDLVTQAENIAAKPPSRPPRGFGRVRRAKKTCLLFQNYTILDKENFLMGTLLQANIAETEFKRLFKEYVQKQALLVLVKDPTAPQKPPSCHFGLSECKSTLQEQQEHTPHSNEHLFHSVRPEATATTYTLGQKVSPTEAAAYLRLGFVGVIVTDQSNPMNIPQEEQKFLANTQQDISGFPKPIETNIGQALRNSVLLSASQAPPSPQAWGDEKKEEDLWETLQNKTHTLVFLEEENQALGRRVARQTIDYLYTHTHQGQEIDPEQLILRIRQFLTQALRDKNTAVGDHALSDRRALDAIVDVVMTEIAQLLRQQKTARKSLPSWAYYLAKRRYREVLSQAIRDLDGTNQDSPQDKLYVKILKQGNFQALTKHRIVFAELKKSVASKYQQTTRLIRNNPHEYLKSEILEAKHEEDSPVIHARKQLAALFNALIAAPTANASAEKNILISALNNLNEPKIVRFLSKHHVLLSKLILPDAKPQEIAVQIDLMLRDLYDSFERTSYQSAVETQTSRLQRLITNLLEQDYQDRAKEVLTNLGIWTRVLKNRCITLITPLLPELTKLEPRLNSLMITDDLKEHLDLELVFKFVREKNKRALALHIHTCLVPLSLSSYRGDLTALSEGSNSENEQYEEKDEAPDPLSSDEQPPPPMANPEAPSSPIENSVASTLELSADTAVITGTVDNTFLSSALNFFRWKTSLEAQSPKPNLVLVSPEEPSFSQRFRTFASDVFDNVFDIITSTEVNSNDVYPQEDPWLDLEIFVKNPSTDDMVKKSAYDKLLIIDFDQKIQPSENTANETKLDTFQASNEIIQQQTTIMSILLGLIGPAKKQAFDKLKLGESFPLPEGLWFKWCFRNKDNIKTLLNKLASENLDDTIEQTALDLVSDLFKHDLEGINSKLQKELDANRPTTDRPRIESLLNKIKGFLDKLSEKTAPQTDLLLDSNFDHLRLMLDQIGNQLENNFDANQTSVFIKAQLGALLSNPAFLNLVKELLEPFSQPELTILLAAMDKGGEFEATQLMALKRYLLGQPLENGDQLILDALFMPQPPHTALDWDHFPIKKHLDLLQELMQELLACQCFFHHHDFTGQQTDDGPVPKLHNQISPSLKWIRVDNNDHTATTRKLSYLHAVNEGLQASDKIREAREKPAQDWLKRIHNHILRPILWPRAYPIWNKLVNGWFNFVNVCKSVFNACLGSNHLQISEKNKESNRCESEANAFNNQFAKLLARGGSAEQKLFALECRNAGGEDSSEQKQDRVLPHPLSQPVGLNNQTLIAQGAKSLNSSGTPSS